MPATAPERRAAVKLEWWGVVIVCRAFVFLAIGRYESSL